MKKILFLLLVASFAGQLQAQRYMTKTGTAVFTSKATLETIEGTNKASAFVLDTKNGALNALIKIKSFVFDKQLMQEHFNENYMESNKFPEAKFKGNIKNTSQINFTKDGEYQADIVGQLTIHGVTKNITEKARLIIKNGKITLSGSFSVLLSDYEIKIPGAVKDKIAKSVKIDIDALLSPTN
ncbi:MAG: YceI family protein [Chitinophagaceae bacterium]